MLDQANDPPCALESNYFNFCKGCRSLWLALFIDVHDVREIDATVTPNRSAAYAGVIQSASPES